MGQEMLWKGIFSFRDDMSNFFKAIKNDHIRFYVSRINVRYKYTKFSMEMYFQFACLP
jgi:hypothetical protein